MKKIVAIIGIICILISTTGCSWIHKKVTISTKTGRNSEQVYTYIDGTLVSKEEITYMNEPVLLGD